MPAVDPFIGSISMVGFNFAPIGWLACDGSLLPIAQYDVLYALIGTTYGGDGVNTFALPDLRGRVPIHVGQGPGLSNRVIGQTAGAEAVTLTVNQIPQHTHSAPGIGQASSLPATHTDPVGHVFAVPVDGSNAYAPSGTAAFAGGVTSGPAGSNQPHSNVQPSLGINFIIAYEGIFPSQA